MAVEIQPILEQVKKNKGISHNDDDEMLKSLIWGIVQRVRVHGWTDDVIKSKTGAIAITLMLDDVRSGIPADETSAFTHWNWMLHNMSQNLTDEQRAEYLGGIT